MCRNPEHREGSRCRMCQHYQKYEGLPIYWRLCEVSYFQMEKREQPSMFVHFLWGKGGGFRRTLMSNRAMTLIVPFAYTLEHNMQIR